MDTNYANSYITNGYDLYSESSRDYGVGSANEVSIDPAYLAETRLELDQLVSQLEPIQVAPADAVTEQVFGVQLRRTQYSLKQLDELINERTQLYRQHLRDIQHRHLEIQKELFGARLHAHEDGHRRALRLEQTLLQLEADRRQEALGFWKDSADLKKASLEQANEYEALRHRVRMLTDVVGEDQYD